MTNEKAVDTGKLHRAWGVTEFALLYYPGANPATAYRRMYRWIHHSADLKKRLYAMGWRPFVKVYTPKQVECLIEFLGEP